MSWRNPPIPWSELERRLSGRPSPRPEGADGGDSPAWSRHRTPYEPPGHLVAGPARRPATVRYAELHCHSNFSFGDGASSPEDLVEEAARLGLEALALTDHDGFYGVVRFAEAAASIGLPTVFGAEVTLGGSGRAVPGAADPPGTHLVVLARSPEGYAALSRALSVAQLAGEKGAPRTTLEDLAAAARQAPGSAAGPDWAVLTGCRKGAVPTALEAHGPSAASHELARLVDVFGRDRVHVELWDHGLPLDGVRNDALAELAVRAGVGVVATNNVHYAAPAHRRLATALAAVRARRSLDEIDGWLPAAGTAHLRSGPEQARRFARYPGAVEAAADLAATCAFDLRLVAPSLPPFPCPDGLDEMGFLRRLVAEGALDRYGHPDSGDELTVRAYAQLEHELGVIEQLGFPGYFLVVWDIVRFCRENDIYCQGRGSAANSAVCFSLGVTAADAVRLGLLFERFLSPGRDGPPDIDIDIESGRREEAIQYVYGRYGRHNAAQVANVITYRPRSAVRDMARALGYAPGQQDAWAKQIDRWGRLPAAPSPPATPAQSPPSPSPSPSPPRPSPFFEPSGANSPVGGSKNGGERGAWKGDVAADHDIPEQVLDLARQVADAPRHLGIHSGGMVICDRPVIEVCPVERARMADRTVLQWDKDDCAAVGLVKFDLLGLGMLTAVHHAVDLIREHRGYEVDLARLPQEDAVYDMLCEADSVGVFQVESRAQMATLPRLRPRTFYDLVVEVALIRPGPIQGGSVHPYIRRRNGQEPVTYLHPLLEPALAKTLGVPLFQEQLMQIAIDVAGFSPAEADELRQAMGAKRSRARMEAIRSRLFDGMAVRGITGDVAEQIWEKLAAFANYGFPESHSVSFAYLVYSSSWIKLHEPAAFCAALLNAQPMGFYSPHSLVQDARRHGVVVHRPDLARSLADATLEPCDGSHNDVAVRLGLSSVRGIGDDQATAIVAERDAHGPYTDAADLARRTGLTRPQLEALALAGAITSGVGGGGSAALPSRLRHPGSTLDAASPGGCAASGVGGGGSAALPSRLRHPGSTLDAASPGGCAASGVGGGGRREALWAAGAAAQARPGRLPGIVTGTDAPALPGMSERDEALADLWATGVSAEGHPTRFVRDVLDRLGVVPAAGLRTHPVPAKVVVGGIVTHRQRPATAGGTMFVNLEDETGLVNVVVSKGCWERYRTVARTAPALLVRGRLERSEGVVNVVAEKLEHLPIGTGGRLRSRNFR